MSDTATVPTDAPVMDAADDTDPTTPPPETGSQDDDADASKRQRGDAEGLRADLARERRARQQAERERDELRPIADAAKTDQQRAIDDARRDGETTATTKLLTRLTTSAIEVAAAGKLANPKLAARLLDVDEFVPADADTDIDDAALLAAIDKLVEDNPGLAVASSSKRTPQAPTGPRGSGTSGTQLTRADLQSMTPQEIDAARKSGRLASVLGQDRGK